MVTGSLVGSALLLVVGSAAAASEVLVVVAGVNEAGGDIRVAACDERDFLKPDCFRSATAPARPGEVEITLREIPPGTYALQAFHDSNGNGELDTDFFGLPEEGMGFSNDAKIRFGPPDFADAAVEIGADDATVRFRIRYFE